MPQPTVAQTLLGPSEVLTTSFALDVHVGGIPGAPKAWPATSGLRRLSAAGAAGPGQLESPGGPIATSRDRARRRPRRRPCWMRSGTPPGGSGHRTRRPGNRIARDAVRSRPLPHSHGPGPAPTIPRAARPARGRSGRRAALDRVGSWPRQDCRTAGAESSADDRIVRPGSIVRLEDAGTFPDRPPVDRGRPAVTALAPALPAGAACARKDGRRPRARA